MFGLVRSLKTEIRDFANRGRVNVVSPGWCETPMTESVLKEEKTMRKITSNIPLQKVATPKDIAAGVIFFASDRLSGHITGEILPVTGGMDGRLLYGELTE
jgi:NAD(P)-dependent dehydrogenase (short-subunit alcohol dehydrogenase family)